MLQREPSDHPRKQCSGERLHERVPADARETAPEERTQPSA
jgi:hypothetical protein